MLSRIKGATASSLGIELAATTLRHGAKRWLLVVMVVADGGGSGCCCGGSCGGDATKERLTS